MAQPQGGARTTPRGAAIVIATTSFLVTVVAGIAMTITDHERYPTIGSGLWWAVQTTTTVGYGDNVPESAAGRLVAAAVMLFGIGFLTVITAAITSTFVARARLEQAASDSGTRRRNNSVSSTRGSNGSKPP